MRALLRLALALVPLLTGIAASAQSPSDPLLQAMKAEMARSIGKLQLPGAPAAYYLEYRVFDSDDYLVQSSFGAITRQQRVHVRVLEATVRVGSYQQDDSVGRAAAIVDLLPIEDDAYATRHALWLATDRAYKYAVSMYAYKQQLLARYQQEQKVDDFSHEPLVNSIGPLAQLEMGSQDWPRVVASLSALYRGDPGLESFSSALRFAATNQYLVNSEGTLLRQGRASYSIAVSGTSQAPDGSRLARSYGEITPTLQEFPKPAKMTSETEKILQQLKNLRVAPAVEQEYHGPVLLLNHAAGVVWPLVVGRQVVGVPPQPGSSAQVAGDYGESYKTRILPAFVSMVDDPTLRVFRGEGLLSAYDYDDEGVKAQKVTVVDHGQLVNYLTSRQPIRDFPQSNGHGRAGSATAGAGAAASPSTLIVSSSQPESVDALKQKLRQLCRDQNLEYGYVVEEMSPSSGDDSGESQGAFAPQRLYRIYANDGHMELVRGAELDALDTRALRDNLLALGDDSFLEGSGNEGVQVGVISPSLLFNNLEIKASSAANDKLPQYPPPSLAVAAPASH